MPFSISNIYKFGFSMTLLIKSPFYLLGLKEQGLKFYGNGEK